MGPLFSFRSFKRPAMPLPSAVDVSCYAERGPKQRDQGQNRNLEKDAHASLPRITKAAVRNERDGRLSTTMVPSAGSCVSPRRNTPYSYKIAFERIQMAIHTNSRLTHIPGLAGATKDRVFLWRRRAATGAAGALALVMAYGVIFGHNGLTAFAHKREEARALQLQTQELQKENDRLHEHVDHLQNDPGAIEHQAREDLHYTRAGEVIVTTGKAATGIKP